MQIEPHAWLITLPLTIAMIQFRLLPENHFVRRCLQTLNEAETQTWDRLGWANSPFALNSRPNVQRAFFCAAVAILALGTLASLAAFLGFAPSA